MAEPSYSFSLPSIEDDTLLDCRVGHPKDLHIAASGIRAGRKHIKGAIVAHPYAPMGGCFDDPVVLSVTETLLEDGFIVGTFNFRGAADSHGHTTWTGRAEQDDYASFIGFMVYYLEQLQPLNHADAELKAILTAGEHLEHGTGSQTDPGTQKTRRVQLLLAGYSYGSLVLARLPPVSSIIQRFESAEFGTSAAEVILRAKTLSKQTVRMSEDMQTPSSPRGRGLKPESAATSPTNRIGVSPITVGGEETDPAQRRRSRDSRRSMDLVRKSVEVPHRIRAHLRRHSEKEDDTVIPVVLSSVQRTPCVETTYLIISPVLLPFTHTLCPPGAPSSVFSLGKRNTKENSNTGAPFLQDRTMALFGSSDVFTSSKSLRAWGEKQSKQSRSSFEWAEVDGAGHFWREEGVMQALRRKVAAWVKAS